MSHKEVVVGTALRAVAVAFAIALPGYASGERFLRDQRAHSGLRGASAGKLHCGKDSQPNKQGYSSGDQSSTRHFGQARDRR